jgi:hypothetical protein
MLLLPIAALWLAASPAVLAPAPFQSPPVRPAAAEDHGKVKWFEGGFEQALAEAAAKKQLVFVDFWTEW